MKQYQKKKKSKSRIRLCTGQGTKTCKLLSQARMVSQCTLDLNQGLRRVSGFSKSHYLEYPLLSVCPKSLLKKRRNPKTPSSFQKKFKFEKLILEQHYTLECDDQGLEMNQGNWQDIWFHYQDQQHYSSGAAPSEWTVQGRLARLENSHILNTKGLNLRAE